MSKASGGAMAAVIGLDEHQVQDIIDRHHLSDIVISNYNTPTQFVIGGPKKSIEAAESVFKQNGARLYIVLNVSWAFHTPYMQSTKEEFGRYIDRLRKRLLIFT